MRALRLSALLALLLVTACAGRTPPVPPGPIRVLLLDGQNNHDWVTTTESLRATLHATGKFVVTVATSPPKGQPPAAWEGFRPDFPSFDVVVSNYNGESWPGAVQGEFVAFIASGGGAVMVHAANNPFPDWPEFNRMIGLGWRKADYGDRITLDDATGAQIRTPKGQGPGAGHGPSHEFELVVRAPTHPIMAGLPRRWLHARDQLSHGQRGPGLDMIVLDSAYAAPERGGTGAHEPMTWLIPYQRGRVVTTMLGHQWRDQTDRAALECPGFRTVFARSVEWAARQQVTLPVLPGVRAVSTP